MDHPASNEPDTSPTARKRRGKNEAKRRFECTVPGCSKTYSRAEHLHRHQLNHNPKTVYHCTFAGCDRSFVREDLFARHTSRHVDRTQPSGQVETSARGRSSSSADAEHGHRSPASVDDGPVMDGGSSLNDPWLGQSHSDSAWMGVNDELTQAHVPTLDLARELERPLRNKRKASQVEVQDRNTVADRHMGTDTTDTWHRASFSGAQTGPNPAHTLSTPLAAQNGSSMYAIPAANGQQVSAVAAVNSSMPRRSMGGYDVHDVFHRNDSGLYRFEATSFGESPASSARDEFASWFFDDTAYMPTNHWAPGPQTSLGMSEFDPFASSGWFSPHLPELRMQTPLPDALDYVSHTSLLSHTKRQQLIDLIEFRFHSSDSPSIQGLRDGVFQSDRDADDHVLSLYSMQRYVSTYFDCFQVQLPLLHQPTFSADSVHEYLLLAVMAVGASHFSDAAAKFANFVVWHLRWHVFMDNDFTPPAKLWVLQTLLLLEVFENLLGTRALHERAHVHSPTTLNLIRRGTALIDESSDAERATNTMPATPEAWWHRWIQGESVRRVAFLAFLMEAYHASMFEHAVSMVVHEVRLPLPCDDALWSATSAAELGRVQASLHANGIKPLVFLDALKRTLTGRKVQTNSFGHMILIAGCQNVYHHMQTRDLQESSLGISQTTSVPSRWRETLSKAFDFWKANFDEKYAHMRAAALPWQPVGSNHDVMADLAAVMHRSSHIILHADFVDCQIYSGATKHFGRAVTAGERQRATQKIEAWAHSPAAKSAAFHSLQLLRHVLVRADGTLNMYDACKDTLLQRPWMVYMSALVLWAYGFATDGPLRPFPSHLVSPYLNETTTGTAPPPGPSINEYPDFFSPPVTSGFESGNGPRQQAMVQDAEAFFRSVAGITTPDALDADSGRIDIDGETHHRKMNRLVGLLGLLASTCQRSRWELLHEAAARLETAVVKLKG